MSTRKDLGKKRSRREKVSTGRGVKKRGRRLGELSTREDERKQCNVAVL